MFYKKNLFELYTYSLFPPMNREFILNPFGEKREIDESQKKVVVQYIQNFNLFGFKSRCLSRSPLLPKNKYSEKVQKMVFWDIGLQKVSSITLMAKKAGHSAFKNWKKVKYLTNVCLKYDLFFYFNKESEIMNSKNIF